MQKLWGKPEHPEDRLASAVQMFSPMAVADAAGLATSQLPRVDCMEPALVALEAGRRYAWCSCGLSQKQPFCDGSHAGSHWRPVLFTAKRTQLDWICTCKFTAQPPYCDAAHNRLPQHYQRHVKEHAVTALPGWHSGSPDNSLGPRIALIHGFLAGRHMERNLLRWVRELQASDRSYVTVAIGCTGGQHRSVYLAERLFAALTDELPNLQLRHRELSRRGQHG